MTDQWVVKGLLDTSCRAAACALERADVLLLCTGAGFSQDSGLPVYASIAHVPAYQAKRLDYADLCQPSLLHANPGLFYGFWGSCFNACRDAEPHEGHKIIRNWKDSRFKASVVAKMIQARLASHQVDTHVPDATGSSITEKRCAGAFFAFTSNVDAHLFDHFDQCEVRECHGRIERWQCGAEGGPCSQQVWHLPSELRFSVQMHDMCVPQHVIEITEDPVAHSDVKTRSLQNGHPESSKLRRSITKPGLCDTANGHTGFPHGENWPKCINCRGPARPAVLMFGDQYWIDDVTQSTGWGAWYGEVCKIASATKQLGDGCTLKVLILDIGSGDTVLTVRHAVEEAACDFTREGANVTVVRINPEIAEARMLINRPDVREIPLPCAALDGLRRMQVYCQPDARTSIHEENETSAQTGAKWCEQFQRQSRCHSVDIPLSKKRKCSETECAPNAKPYLLQPSMGLLLQTMLSNSKVADPKETVMGDV